ncbi:uncharacterized protein LOC124821025 [Vigna umbellata]|uniref:uncharacterized protein LOC124821025 n=1 Tax=Vigna umbellata TaxID=87088 RepID=UPI001F5EE4C9|nr:uncharacterized protein LOC124821025 [Vigna umbellata]
MEIIEIDDFLPSPSEKKRQLKELFTHENVDLLVHDTWQQFSVQAKHMEQISKRKRYEEEERDKYKAIQRKLLPAKEKDPGSFFIPCVIEKKKVDKALLDLGSSVNLMPYSLLEQMGNLKVKPIKMNLLVADGSLKNPYGIAEDVMVCVGELKFLVDFVIMEMKDERIPIILGRPFMKTAKVIIDVDEGIVVFQDRGKNEVIDVFKEEQWTKTSYKATC